MDIRSEGKGIGMGYFFARLQGDFPYLGRNRPDKPYQHQRYSKAKKNPGRIFRPIRGPCIPASQQRQEKDRQG